MSYLEAYLFLPKCNLHFYVPSYVSLVTQSLMQIFIFGCQRCHAVLCFKSVDVFCTYIQTVKQNVLFVFDLLF